MSAPVIEQLDTRLITLPLERPWGPDVTEIHVVAVDVRDSDGDVGHGFSWTPTIGAHAVEQLLARDIAAFAEGRPADPAIWPEAWAHLHEAGSGGVTTIALAGLDLALWDLRARRSGRSVTDAIGRRRDALPAYGSGVNLHYPLADLVAQTERWVQAGFRAVKVKVGSPDIARDVERIRADLARERSVQLAPHLLPELSAQVAFALPEETWIEDVESAGFAQLGALEHPTGLEIRDGWATGGPALGLGMRFR